MDINISFLSYFLNLRNLTEGGGGGREGEGIMTFFVSESPISLETNMTL